MQKKCPFCKRFVKQDITFHTSCVTARTTKIENEVVKRLGVSVSDAVKISVRIVTDWGFFHSNEMTYAEYLEKVDFGEAYQKVKEDRVKIKEFENRNQESKQLVMDLRGGAREGAGRKRKGTRKAVSINLPDGEWEKIQSKIDKGEVEGFSDYFVSLHLEGSHVHS